jgi:hypothetical protein
MESIFIAYYVKFPLKISNFRYFEQRLSYKEIALKAYATVTVEYHQKLCIYNILIDSNIQYNMHELFYCIYTYISMKTIYISHILKGGPSTLL